MYSVLKVSWRVSVSDGMLVPLCVALYIEIQRDIPSTHGYDLGLVGGFLSILRHPTIFRFPRLRFKMVFIVSI